MTSNSLGAKKGERKWLREDPQRSREVPRRGASECCRCYWQVGVTDIVSQNAEPVLPEAGTAKESVVAFCWDTAERSEAKQYIARNEMSHLFRYGLSRVLT